MSESMSLNEDRFRAFIAATSDMVYCMSPDWSEVRHLAGRQFIADNASPGRGWLHKYLHPEDRQRVTAAIDKAIRTKSNFELEHRVIRTDGSLGWTHSRAVPVLDENGEILEWIGAARDITQRKADEEAMSQVRSRSEQQLRLYLTILAATPDLVYVFDLNHRFIYANQALLTLWGRSWDDAIGKNCLELGYEPWHAEMHDREIEQVIATRQPIRGDVPFTGTHGRRMYDYIFVPVLNGTGEVEAIAGTTRDVTDRKEAEDALRDADRRKDEFLAMLAHELRNPLAPISNAMHLLRKDRNADTVQVQARAIIERQTGRLTRLVDDLLEVSRITSGRIQLHKEQVAAQEVLERAVETVRPLIEQHGHKLALELPRQPVWVHADAARLEQVVVNLLNNAAKYTDSGGRIELDLRLDGSDAAIRVRDNGMGIESELLPRVFDLFTQAERSLDRSRGGLGVGLSLVKRLVEMHGGNVTAASVVGQGSTFVVNLPAMQPKPVEPAIEETGLKNNAAPAMRILIVDDNVDAAQSLAMLLGASGYDVRIAFDGLTALQTAREHKPDVALLDIGLPGLDGYALARQLRAELPGSLGLVAMTGYGQESDRRRSQAAGFDLHLVKPVDFTALEELLPRFAK